MVGEGIVGGERWRWEALTLGTSAREEEPADSGDNDEDEEDKKKPASRGHGVFSGTSLAALGLR